MARKASTSIQLDSRSITLLASRYCLASSSSALPPIAGLPAPAHSRVAEFEIDAGDVVVSGSKTIQVEVKE